MNIDRQIEDTEIHNCINTNITTMSYRTQLLPCAICGRKFQIARLKDHEDICRRVTENAKRKEQEAKAEQRKEKQREAEERQKKGLGKFKSIFILIFHRI